MFGIFFFFFFNDTATTEIYTLSLHDALPISGKAAQDVTGDPQTDKTNAATAQVQEKTQKVGSGILSKVGQDRKSTRLNSSHQIISYAVFCLKKKKKKIT